MATTINHTGRVKLKRDNYEIALIPGEDGVSHFTFQLNTADHKNIDGDARVFVEAKTGNTIQRFDFGTVSKLTNPETTRLDKLSANASPDFRVLIVDSRKNERDDETQIAGRISAMVERVHANTGSDEEGGSSLLIVTTTDLGQMLWNIKMNPGDRPELCLNNKLPDAKHLLTSKPEYKALVLPAAFRQVIASYHAMDTRSDRDDTVQQQWWLLAESFGGTLDEDVEADEFTDWLDDVIGEFCKQHAFCETLVELTKTDVQT